MFKTLLLSYGFEEGFFGYMPRELYSIKQDLLYIGGTLSAFSIIKKDLKVCAIISTFNEEDIIEQVCKYLLNQGINVHIIDNWSTDTTIDRVKSIKDRYSGFSYEIFPSKDKKQYIWFDMLNKKLDYGSSHKYDWYIHYDADEIREGCFQKFSLLDNIKFIDSLGFNAIDHTVIDFRPVTDGFNSDIDPEKHFNYFEFGRRPGHFAQIKAWKNIPNTSYNLSNSGGHIISFEGIKVYPYKFLLKHYSLRSLDHMKKKIFKDRLPRFESDKKKYGWHTHYDKYIGKESRISLWKESELEYFKDDFYEENLLERIFGVNIERE